MLTAGIFTFIGIALFIKSKKSGHEVSLTDIWTEFAGDGIQKIVEKILDFVKNSREKKKLTDIIDNSFDIENDLDTYKQICREVKESEQKPGMLKKNGILDKIIDKFSQIKNKLTDSMSRKTIDIKTVCSLSEAVIYELDYKAYLEKCSPKTFAKLEEEKKAKFIALIKLVIDVYRKDIFAGTSEEIKVMTALIIYSIKNFIEFKNNELQENFEKRIETRFLQIVQAGDDINFQKIELTKYAPKYMLKACPGCGYSGARIYVNEKTNTVHCAACGKGYSIIRYCEPEYWKQLNDELARIHGNMSEADEEIKRLVADNAVDLAEIKNGLEQVATRSYLEACMRENFESFTALHKSAKADAEAFIKEYFDDLSAKIGDVGEGVEDIKSQLAQFNEQYKVHNRFLSKKLNSYSEQLNQVYSFAQSELSEMGVKSDLILQYIQKLFSKEYLEDMSYALGTNLKNAINFNADNVVALNTSSISQILAAIDDLKINWNRARGDESGDVKTADFERLIYDQTAQLSGQVNGLQELIKNNHVQYSNAFRAIIASQEEMKNILLSKVGLSQNSRMFEKMYSGKIPSRYLYNEGFGGVFPCPYCGAEEERVINDEQYCRCSVCKQKFLAVDLSLKLKDINPFFEIDDTEADTLLDIIAKKYGRSASDPLLATDDRVKEWRAVHSAKIEERAAGEFLLLKPEAWKTAPQRTYERIDRTLLIIPYVKGCVELNSKNCVIKDIDDLRFIKTLVLSYGIKYIDVDILAKFSRVNKIVFIPQKSIHNGMYQFSYESLDGEILEHNRLFIPRGREIKVYGKNFNGQDIIVEEKRP